MRLSLLNLWRMMARTVVFLCRLVDEILPTLLIAFTIIMVSTDIFLRNSIGRTIPNGIELSTYAFVWSIFLAAAGASRTGHHFQVDLISGFLGSRLLGRRGQRALAFIIELLCAAIAIAVFQTSQEYVMRSWNRTSEGLGLPLGYFYMVFPLSFALMATAHLIRAGRCFAQEEVKLQVKSDA